MAQPVLNVPAQMPDRREQAPYTGLTKRHCSQYTALKFTERLGLDGMVPSIGTVGDAYDNALMESIIGLYKNECIRTTIFHQGPYKTINDVEYATLTYVDWYNNRRLHSTIGYNSPAAHESHYYATKHAASTPNTANP